MKKIFLFFVLLSFAFFLSDVLAQPTTPILTMNTSMHTGCINRISSDASGRLILTCSNDKTAKLWNAQTGELIQTFRVPIAEGNEGSLYSCVISPDGKTVVVGGWTGYEWDAKHSIYIIDVAANTIKHRISGLPNVIQDLEFSNNGNFLVATMGSDGIRIFETASWTLIKSFSDYASDSYCATFNHFGMLATACFDGKIRLYSAAFEFIKEIETTGGKRPYSIAFSPDGSLLAVGYNDSYYIQVLDGKTLQLLYEPDITDANSLSQKLTMVSFSTDGLQLIAGGYCSKIVNGAWWKQIRVWSAKGEGSYYDYTACLNSVSDIKPMPDNSFIFSSTNPDFGRMNTAGNKFFYNATETNAYNLTDKTHFKINSFGSIIGITPVGKSALTFSVPDRLLSLTTFNDGTTYSDNYSGIRITDWNHTQIPKINTKNINFLKANETSYSVDISKDANKIVFGSNWYIRCVDADGSILWTTPIQEVAFCVNISDNDKVVVAGLGDGTICWYNMDDGKLLLSLFIHPDNQRWVMWTPKGYFDCSSGAENLIGWHVNQGPDTEALYYPVSKFRDIYYRPDIVSKIMETYNEDEAIRLANEASNRKTTQNNIAQMLPPVVSISSPLNGQEVSSSSVTVKYKVNSPNNEPVTSIKILIDGRPLETRGFIPINDGEEISVTIPQFDCTIGIMAENKYGFSVPAEVSVKFKSSQIVVAEDILKPTLYVVAIGISAYQDLDLKLGFAAKDASDFANCVKAQKGLLYKDVQIKLITDAQATRMGILEGLDWLQTQTTARDVAMLFIAGHGVNDNSGVFYFLPFEADKEKIRSTCLMFAEVKNTVATIAGKIIVFADACHSGNILGGNRRGLDINGLVNELGSAETGAVVFTSSTGNQYSLENPEWNNGAFTKALIEGLNGKADLFNNGKITIKTLDAYISNRVKELTGGQQSPTTIIPESIPDFSIIRVK